MNVAKEKKSIVFYGQYGDWAQKINVSSEKKLALFSTEYKPHTVQSTVY